VTANSSEYPQVIALVGPTGSGKSALGMALAQVLDTHILSCDSVQVYRKFNIGSAKPTSEDRALVPHHLIDMVDWDNRFDAEQYRREALKVLRALKADGKDSVVLVGGTGLYLRLLRWGVIDAPASDIALREALEADEKVNSGSLWKRLHEVDPESAEQTAPGNIRHLSRALEIYLSTGQKASELRRAHGFSEEQVPMWVFELAWSPEILRARIRARLEAMFKSGWREEVKGLLDEGVSSDCTPMKAVGYRELCALLEGRATSDDLEKRIFKSTWTYARRQRTWFRKERALEKLSVGLDFDVFAADFGKAMCQRLGL